MTKKIYKTAQGKTVDLGSLILQNENVRAVGNMGVNARGDVLDSGNRIIDKKSSQVNRQNRQNPAMSSAMPDASTISTRQAQQAAKIAETVKEVATTTEVTASGLAGAIARSKTTTEEK